MTIKEHLKQLPEPARTRALANMWWERADDKAATPRIALRLAFLWFRSPEGYDYWQGIANTLPTDADAPAKPPTTA